MHDRVQNITAMQSGRVLAAVQWTSATATATAKETATMTVTVTTATATAIATERLSARKPCGEQQRQREQQ